MVGNASLLVGWLALAWTLGAFGEEMAFQGCLLNRVAGLSGSRFRYLPALAFTGIVFGLGHSYQGVSGMISTGLGNVFSGVLYLWMGRNLWASIVAHGVVDTLGILMIFLGRYPGM